MLRATGAGSFEELIGTVPAELRLLVSARAASQRETTGTEANRHALDVPDGLAEAQVVELCERLAGRNRSLNHVTMATFIVTITNDTPHTPVTSASWIAESDGVCE